MCSFMYFLIGMIYTHIYIYIIEIYESSPHGGEEGEGRRTTGRVVWT